MSFYDDLGVRHGATEEEIREQYRVLVRLLHPDQFSDPALKTAAESQMRRVNEIGAVLTDPDRRRDYEARLMENNAEPAIVIQAAPPVRPPRPVPWNSLAWGAACMACAGAIVWVSGRDAVPTPPPVEVRTIVGPPASNRDDWRARAKAAFAERDQALKELARLRAEIGQPNQSTAANAETDTVNRFAGIWFYAQQSGSDGKLPGPEFIETLITEKDGQVHGRYRSRYAVTDRADTTSINFDFVGRSAGTSAQMPFVREDGSRGEVRLRLLSEREMELAWTAPGAPAPLLNGGTAVLVKGQ